MQAKKKICRKDMESRNTKEEIDLQASVTKDMDTSSTNNGDGEVHQSVGGGAASSDAPPLGLVTLPDRRRQPRRGAILPMDPKKCCTNSTCKTRKTVMWRKGPLGPNTLCNACGIQYTKEGVDYAIHRHGENPRNEEDYEFAYLLLYFALIAERHAKGLIK